MGSLQVNGIVRITRDAEVRKSSSGAWLNFGIASFRKNPKENKQSSDFFDCDLYVKNYTSGFESNFIKGKLLHIETAYLKNDRFTGTDNKEKSRIKLQVVAYEVLNDKVELPDAKEETKNPKSIHPSDLPPPGKQFYKKEESPKEEIMTIQLPEEEEEIPF